MEALVKIENQQIVTDSRQIAEHFEKQHKDVLRAINNLIAGDQRKIAPMFFESTALDSYGREQKIFLMNRDGFTLLAMGFTGKKALEWKLKYIAAFNEMEAQLKANTTVKLTDDERAKQMRADAMLRNAQVRQAKVLRELAEQAVTTSAKAVLLTQAANIAAGKNILSLPRADERATMTATDLCQHFNLADTWVSVLSKRLNQRLERNEKTGYHTQTLTPSGKQVKQWNWFTDVVLPVAKELEKNGVFKGHYKH